MKNLLSAVLFSLLAIGTATQTIAQTTEAVIHYEVSMESEDEMVAQQLAMMSGSTMKMSFKDDNFRMDMDMMMKTTTIITNGKKDKSIMLMDMMGQKMAIPMDKKTIEENRKEKSEQEEKQQIEVTKEYKTIAGYKCNKVIITNEDGTTMIMYVTDQIKPANNQNKYGGKKVNGFPLYMEIEKNLGGMEMTMVMAATKVETKVKDKKLFEVEIPEGYSEKTMEDLKALGMGG